MHTSVQQDLLRDSLAKDTSKGKQLCPVLLQPLEVNPGLLFTLILPHEMAEVFVRPHLVQVFALVKLGIVKTQLLNPFKLNHVTLIDRGELLSGYWRSFLGKVSVCFLDIEGGEGGPSPLDRGLI